MSDRYRLLYASGYRPRQLQQPEQPAQPGDDTSTAPIAFIRVFIRTDSPLVLKRERGRMAGVAYNIRKNNGLSTRNKIVGTSVIL